MKRNEEDSEGDQSPVAVCGTWPVVLNMSLMKLYSPQTTLHLTLQHRVLISNIIRSIHSDFPQEGDVGALLFSAAPPPCASSHHHHQPQTPA